MVNEGVLIRNVRHGDMQSLCTLARESRVFHLPVHKESLREIVDIAVKSFKNNLENQSDRLYIFVAEDMTTSDIVGCSMLFPKRGGKDLPLYVFKLSNISKELDELDQSFEYALLQLTSLENNYTELGGLAVSKSCRNSKSKIGTQLSIVRFIFLSMTDLYRDNLLVQLTPPTLKSGKNVFWESIGRKFINMDPVEAEKTNAITENAILSLFPREPIYVCLLGGKFLRYFKKIDKNAIPAYKILSRLGFKKLNMFNPFDGGCYMSAAGECNSFLATPRSYLIDYCEDSEHTHWGFVSYLSKNRFLSVYVATRMRKRKIVLHRSFETILRISPNSEVVFHNANLFPSIGDAK